MEERRDERGERRRDEMERGVLDDMTSPGREVPGANNGSQSPIASIT